MDFMTKLMVNLGGVPDFAIYLLAGAVCLVAFLRLYTWATPHDEFLLIRDGQPGAAIGLGGAVLGFCIPLAMVIAHSRNLTDMAFWAVVALVVQIVAFFIGRIWVASDDLAKGDLAGSTLMAFIAVGVGLLNAACMTP